MGDGPRPGTPPRTSLGARTVEVFWAALLLGLTSFGGPIAHLGYFHREYVGRRRWLAEATYLDLVGLCQVLPGPASSQVGISVGLLRAGWGGALAAWLGFTLPSAVLLTGFATVATDPGLADAGWVHGLKLAAVAVVGATIVSMWRAIAVDGARRALAVAAAVVVLLLPSSALQVAVIAGGGLLGWWMLRHLPAPSGEHASPPVRRRTGVAALALFVALLVGLPALAAATGSESITVVDAFYRAGALVFGGGHVVLPLLSESVVTPGWVDRDTFLAGYGAAQAVPGPLFTFAAFLGASLRPEPNGIAGATVAIVAIFLPSFLLVAAALPFWGEVRRAPALRGAMAGAGATVIGLLAAALIDPLWVGSVASPVDAALVALAFVTLVLWRAPPVVIVIALALAGQLQAVVGVG